MTRRCQSCRWWDRSNNFRAIGRDWGLCHLWGGRIGRRLPNGLGFIDGTFGHEPLGGDTCDHHNAAPERKAEILSGGSMPLIKYEGAMP